MGAGPNHTQQQEPPKTVTNKLSRSRLKATKEEMVEMKTKQKKKKTRLKLPQTLIGSISARHQMQRK